jgi:hypothetical protein
MNDSSRLQRLSIDNLPAGNAVWERFTNLKIWTHKNPVYCTVTIIEAK